MSTMTHRVQQIFIVNYDLVTILTIIYMNDEREREEEARERKRDIERMREGERLYHYEHNDPYGSANFYREL